MLRATSEAPMSDPISLRAARRLEHLLPMLLVISSIVLRATFATAGLNSDVQCISAGSNPIVSRKIGRYTVRLNADSAHNCKLSVIDGDSGHDVFNLTAPGLGGQITIDKESGDPISGGKVPVLKLMTVSHNPEPFYELRYIFASLGEKFEVLKDIRNHFAVHAERLNKDGPIYLVTWDGVLYRFLLDELQSSPFFYPEVILRLDGHSLLNSSGCFRDRYDKDIAYNGRQHLTTRKVEQFLNAPPAKRNTDANILTTKGYILLVIADYLYSGREAQAWQALNEMWPANDRERIKAALLHAYQTGILAQTDGLDHCEAKPYIRAMSQ
jgi:hypothetical protein